MRILALLAMSALLYSELLPFSLVLHSLLHFIKEQALGNNQVFAAELRLFLFPLVCH